MCQSSTTPTKSTMIKHRLNKEIFLKEMEKRGWKIDPNGWIVPEGRRTAQREADWTESIIACIECSHEKKENGTKNTSSESSLPNPRT
jgi:hypothetical protein